MIVSFFFIIASYGFYGRHIPLIRNINKHKLLRVD
jgi:hypothetical protein